MGACFPTMGSSNEELSARDMNYLKSNTHYDEDLIRNSYKDFKKDIPTGELSPEKLCEMYKSFFPNGDSHQFCENVFRTFDMDKSGAIDFKEFFMAIYVTNAETVDEKLKWAFKLYDINGDGVIGRKEMTNIIQAVYDMLGKEATADCECAEDRSTNIFKLMDMNNDGYINEDEFIRGCQNDTELCKMLAPNIFK